MIDLTKPIETVPCERNPLPVPCVYDPHQHGVEIRADWYDIDGENVKGTCWDIEDDGAFFSIIGSIRNVIEQPATPDHPAQEMVR